MFQSALDDKYMKKVSAMKRAVSFPRKKGKTYDACSLPSRNAAKNK